MLFRTLNILPQEAAILKFEAKATTIKEAITKFEEHDKCKANESKKVMLLGLIPPIEKMDASLSTLVNCEKSQGTVSCKE